MKYQGRCIGLGTSSILVLSYIIGHGTKLEPFFIVFVAAVCSMVLWLGNRFDELKEQTERDSLTKTYNRTYLRNRLPRMLKRYGVISICVIDIDKFKQINDSCGHLVGDQVLRKIADGLKENTRREDIVVRWGGDEFLLITHDVSDLFLASLEQRINHTLSQLSDEIRVPVQVSIGLGKCENYEELESDIHKADSQMYQVKRLKQKEWQVQHS